MSILEFGDSGSLASYACAQSNCEGDLHYSFVGSFNGGGQRGD